MANTSIVTQEMLQDTLQNYHENLVYPFLNGATHTGCVPLGTILPYFGETAPTHFLICDGTEYAKVDYPELAEHLLALTDPSPYVVSGDNTKFKVPDLRGEFLRGSGTNSHSGQGNGDTVGTHQDGTEHPHIGTWKESSNIQFTVDRAYNVSGNGYTSVQTKEDSIPLTRNGVHVYSTSQTIDNTDNTPAAFTSRPTNTSVTYIIAYRNAYIDLALDSFPIDITQPTDGQLLMYDATAGRWVNGGHKYSTDEHVVGKWIDGKPVYERTITNLAMPQIETDGQSDIIRHNLFVSTNVDKLIDFDCTIGDRTSNLIYKQNNLAYDNSAAETTMLFNSWLGIINNYVVLTIRAVNTVSNGYFAYITIQYTKTTDTV